VSWINARRRRPVAGYAALLLGLVVVGMLYGAFTRSSSSAQASSPPASQSDINTGKNLFEATCSSCHGLDAQGTSQGPSLIGSGAAAVNFQVSTGRMPAKEIGAENERKPPVFNAQQIAQLGDYVASLGGGPAVPDAQQVATSGANTGLGSQLFSANCAQCHGFAGAGGASLP
jgi:ubiquinol-cytochrome c reductase cytochrome c subunit